MPRVVGAQWRGRHLSAVLFDLDGTLLDTVADIALALNRAMAGHGCRPLAESEVSRMIGRGAPILIERAAAAQGLELDEANQDILVERFFHYYGELEKSNDDRAQPYPGAVASLRALHDAGVRSAVVTNNQQRFADALLNRLGLASWVDIVVGGDTCARRTPDPQPLQIRRPPAAA